MKKRLSGIGLACGLALLTSCDAALNLPIRKDSSTVINMGYPFTPPLGKQLKMV